eukprot:3026952-Prymnesium_polylepis.2
MVLVNAQLLKLKQPELKKVEMIGGRLYTGPLFVKYNAVLRGYNNESSVFLQKQFISLCCESADEHAFETNALAFSEARQRANLYTTTIHAINSSVVKLSKLTTAVKPSANPILLQDCCSHIDLTH